MDFEFWIYVIIGIVYFLTRLFKKAEPGNTEVPPPQRKERPRPASAAPEPSGEGRPLTFEELLREITEAKRQPKPQPRPEPEPQPVPVYEPYEQDPGPEAKSLEEVGVDEVSTATRWKGYEQIPADYERVSLEEKLRLEDTVVDFKRFDVFEKREDKKPLEEYIRIMRNPEALRQAFVMSEILQRKF